MRGDKFVPTVKIEGKRFNLEACDSAEEANQKYVQLKKIIFNAIYSALTK